MFEEGSGGPQLEAHDAERRYPFRPERCIYIYITSKGGISVVSVFLPSYFMKRVSYKEMAFQWLLAQSIINRSP